MNTRSSEASPQEQASCAARVNPTTTTADESAQAANGPPRQPAQPPGESGPAASESAAPAAGPPQSAPPLGRGRIQVGSRRDKAPPRPRSAGRQENQEATEPLGVEPPVPPRAPVRPPSVREPLSADLEREFAAVMGDASLDEILDGAAGPQPVAALELESRQQACVVRIHGDNVFFALAGRHEGVASARQFTEPPQLGAEMEVIIKGYHEDDGLYEVLIPGASAHVEDWSDLVEGAVVEARITGANTGGFECRVGTIRGFIPSSQIAMFRVEDYAQFLDQKLLCVVTEVNPKRKNLVLSRRAVLEREKEASRKALLESLEVGQVVEGVVRSLRDFGAFVELGDGVDGLVHISQLSWDRVDHPREVLQEGQKVRVKIEKIDLQTGKIGLSYRDLLEHPWLHIDQKFPIDAVVRGTVSRIAKFGAFVKLAPGVEGLIHISELAHGRVSSVGSVVSEGQEVDVKVLSVDTESQRIALSIKAALPEPAPEAPEPAGPEEAPREPAVPRRQVPLRGGTDRASGGEQFGLKW